MLDLGWKCKDYGIAFMIDMHRLKTTWEPHPITDLWYSKE